MKIFGVGLPKTGTTSLSEALRILGYTSIHYPTSFDQIKEFDSATDSFVAINYKKLDKGLSCMIAVTLLRQGKRNMQPFDEQLKKLPEVEKFYHVTGRFDYIIKVNLKDVDDVFGRFPIR